jgi:L-asparagine transporter-like permease
MPWVATIVMGVLAVFGCLVPMDVLLNATGSTLAFSYGFIALAAIVMRRNATSDAGDGYRMPWWPMPPAVALLAILAIFVVGALDPHQWLSLGIAVGIIATGFAYYFCYLRPRAGTHLLLLEVSADEEV